MLDSLSAWADARRDLALGLIRLYLGIGLFVRGLVFLADIDAFFALASASGDVFSSTLVAYYVALAHVTGGLLLAAGTLTRLAALIQIPVLFAATFFVHLPDSLLTADQSFAFSALVLALLVVFAIWGGGRWSLDRAVERWSREREAAEAEESEIRLREIRARGRVRRERAPERPAVLSSSPEPACQCGHGSDHPRIRVRREYSALSRLRFVFGTHPRPTRVTVTCRDCGGVVEVTTDVEATESYRFIQQNEA